MTVNELIVKLQQADPQSIVLVDGYEGGYEELEKISFVSVTYNKDQKWYYGPYDDTEYGGKTAVLLPRN